MNILPNNTTGNINKLATMYSSIAYQIVDGECTIPPYSTAYGLVMVGTAIYNDREMAVGEYFCITNTSNVDRTITITGSTAVFIRYGYIGQNIIGGPVEESGRLVYIDGCSDTLLVYPPRKGDPSLNYLYFPKGVEQSFHIHPSIRFGCVFAGRGYADLGDSRVDLVPGSVFCIDEREIHRFVTTDSDMTIVAYHPDGEWGPEDHNHTMLNRTYLMKK